jgi:hypothetical protein
MYVAAYIQSFLSAIYRLKSAGGIAEGHGEVKQRGSSQRLTTTAAKPINSAGSPLYWWVDRLMFPDETNKVTHAHLRIFLRRL